MKKVNEDAGKAAGTKSDQKPAPTGAAGKQNSAGKASEALPDYQLGNLFQRKTAAAGAPVKKLDAKKLDINFDADDFFNSFEPVSTAPKPTAKPEVQISKPKETTQAPEQNSYDASAWLTDAKKEENAFGGTAGKKATSSQGAGALEDDVQARYDLLVKSGATAISSDMLFGREEQVKQPSSQGGRWSQPAVAASLQAMGERTQAAIGNAMSRSSMGSEGSSSLQEYKDVLKEKGGQLASGAYQKGGELAAGAYQSATYAKHAALDWITSMTASTGNNTDKRGGE